MAVIDLHPSKLSLSTNKRKKKEIRQKKRWIIKGRATKMTVEIKLFKLQVRRAHRLCCYWRSN